MNHLHFNDTPQQRHRVLCRPGSDTVQVDDAAITARADGTGRFVATLNGRSERLLAVAHGDTVHVHWRGRAWRIDRIDPLRSSAAGGHAAGAEEAPMPGVVVSLQVQVGQHVREGDALLVIESMKLQTTICAACDGTVQELPLAVGQTFQRGALLARIVADEEAK